MEPNTHHDLLEAVRQYRVPPQAADLLKNHPPLIIAGVTAAGKASVAKYIQTESDWEHAISHTTRALRPGEQNGKDYWFVSEEEMLRLIKNNAFIEVKNIHDIQISGSSIEAYKKVLQDGHKPLLINDVHGIINDISNFLPDIQAFFILPPSFEEWMRRLESRGHMSHIEKLRRLKSAREELEIAMSSRHFKLIVNNDIVRTAAEVIQGTTDPGTQYRNRELAQQLINHISHY